MIRFALLFFSIFGHRIVSSPCHAENGAEQASYVMALLKAKCADCHTGAEPSGGFNLAELKVVSGEDDGKRDKQWNRVFHVIVTTQMPPVEVYHSTKVSDPVCHQYYKWRKRVSQRSRSWQDHDNVGILAI